MLPLVLKKTFWVCHDHLATLLWLSLLWCLLNLPLLALAVHAAFVDKNLALAATAWNALWTSPATAAAVFQAGRMVEGRTDARGLAVFLEGLLRHGPRSLLLCGADAAVFWSLVRSWEFWFRNRLGIPLVLSWSAAGLVLAFVVVQAAMRFSLLPLLVLRNEGVWSSAKKSVLVVLADLRLHLAAGVLGVLLCGLSLLSGAGFLLVFPAFFAVFASVLTLSVLSRYNPSVRLEPETRGWRDLLRPWE